MDMQARNHNYRSRWPVITALVALVFLSLGMLAQLVLVNTYASSNALPAITQKVAGVLGGTATPVPPSTTPCVFTQVFNEGFESGTLGVFISTVIVTSTTTPVPTPGWASVAANPHSGTRSAFAPDPDRTTDSRLTTISNINIPAGVSTATLTFWHRFAFENTFDGGVLEVSTDGGATWADAEANIQQGGYNGTIAVFSGCVTAGTPPPFPSGKRVWTGSMITYAQVRVNLLPYQGTNMKFRFRLGTDCSVSNTGWNIDDVVVSYGDVCAATGTPTSISTMIVTPTSTFTSTPVLTPTNTRTPTLTATHTAISTLTSTPMLTATNTAMPTLTSTHTAISTFTSTPVLTATNTAILTSTATLTSAPTASPTNPPSNTPALTANPSPTGTRSPIPSPSSPTACLSPTSTPTATCTVTFSDVPPGFTFYSYIRCLACRGIISGYADGTFRPNNSVTRGQISKMIANADLVSDPVSSTQQTFTDVPPANPFWLFIERLAAHGYISGYPCGGTGEPCDAQNRPYFRWGNNVTRGQIAKIDTNTAAYTDAIPATQQTFTDVPNSNPFWLFIERAALNGILGGYPCGGPGEPCDSQNRPYFRWGNDTTRGQAAKIVSNTFYPNCQDPTPTPVPTNDLPTPPVNSVPGYDGTLTNSSCCCPSCLSSTMTQDTTGSGKAGIYLHSGEVYLVRNDLSVPGRNGFNAQFGGVYTSGRKGDGPLGYGWTDRNFRFLYLLPCSDSATVFDGLGHSYTYTRRSDGSYQAPPGFSTKLASNPDGSFIEQDRANNRVQYAPLDASGRARMTARSNRKGDTETFDYDALGRLSHVYDAYGRPTTYTYGAASRVTRIRNYAGQAVVYTYDSHGDLVAVTTQAVTNTPNGNNFPAGKTTRYTYSSGYADPKLNHNLLSITYPNEVALGGPPAETFTYDAQDRLRTHTVGGTNASGIPAGGTITYTYNPLQTDVVERDGNHTRYQFDPEGHVVQTRKYNNRNIRPGDPLYYESLYAYNTDGRVISQTLPAGNTIVYTYDTANPDPFQHGNLLAEIHYPDAARGGDQSVITQTTYTYEPIYNQVYRKIEARGNDLSYVPQNGGPWSPARYTITYTYDYQEGNNAAALAARLNLPVSVVQARLAAADIPTNLGDLNGDGRTDQIDGMRVREQKPTVNLLPGSNMAAIEGSTQQPIVAFYTYNSHGQLTRSRDAEGNETLNDYYPENDPDGDGRDPVPGLGTGHFGYLKSVTRDTRSDPLRNSHTNPPPANQDHRYYYDPVGNMTAERDGRGIITRYTYNALNQMVQVSRAADVSGARTNPEEPNWAACTDSTLPECTQGMVAFQYLERRFYDYNDNVVLAQVEDRGNTSGVDGNPPPADLPLYITNPDPSGGTAYVDTVTRYDILNQPIEMVAEVANGASPTFLRTRYRYDRDGNRVLEISPAAVADQQPSNVVSYIYDERGLLYTTTRGGLTAQFRTLPAHADIPEHNTIPNSPDIATTSASYDANGNLKQTVDAVDNSGDGQADRTSYLYDGYDRLVSVVDAIGNQSFTQYDPAGNAVANYRFGPLGGASPIDDSAATFSQPLTATSFLQPLLSRNALNYDEHRRVFERDDRLFIYTGTTYLRTPVLRDGPLGTPNDGWVTTRPEYDRLGRQTFQVADDLSTTRYYYDGLGRSIRTHDPETNDVYTTYDDNDNVIKTIQVEVTSPDAVGAARVPALSHTYITRYVYDALNRDIRSSDTLGQTKRTTYDSRANILRATDAQYSTNAADLISDPLSVVPGPTQINRPGNVTRYVYDGQSRQLATVQELRVGGQGRNAIDTSNPNNPDGLIVTDQHWDANNRLIAQADDGSSPADQNTSIGVIEPGSNARGNVTRYTYDDLNRLKSEIYDDSTTQIYTYDRDDNPHSQTDPNGSVMAYTYDGDNRLVHKDIARAPGIVGTTQQTYQYDGLSRQTRAFDNNEPGDPNDDAVVTYAYESLSRLLEEVQNGQPVSSQWNGVNTRLGLIYPNGRTLQMTYDKLDRLSVVSDTGAPQQLFSYDYIGPSRVLERRAQNGTHLTYLNDARSNDTGYDALGRAIQPRTLRSDNTLVVGFGHTFDRQNDKRIEERLHDPANSELYTYDSTYRLADFQRGRLNPARDAISTPSPNLLQREQWVLDGVGNWPVVTDTIGGIATSDSRTHNNLNELRSRSPSTATPTPITYDANGSQTNDGTNVYAYDAANRLRRVTRNGTLLAVYSYDAANRRVREVISDTPGLNGTIYTYIDGWQEIEERDSVTVTRQVVYGIYMDEPVVLDRPGQPRLFYHQNTQYSIHALTDEAGVIKEGYSYDAYGRQTVYQPGTNGRVDWGGDDVIAPLGRSAVGNPYLYTGRRLDGETGFYYYRHRNMNADQGRFVSRDPKGYVDGLNLYEYVRDNPINSLDPSGLECKCCSIIATAKGEARNNFSDELGGGKDLGFRQGWLANDKKELFLYFNFRYKVMVVVEGKKDECVFDEHMDAKFKRSDQAEIPLKQSNRMPGLAPRPPKGDTRVRLTGETVNWEAYVGLPSSDRLGVQHIPLYFKGQITQSCKGTDEVKIEVRWSFYMSVKANGTWDQYETDLNPTKADTHPKT